MQPETAIQTVENYLSNKTNEYDECVIEFFGGEPFLNFPLIRQVCEYVWSKQWNKPYLFFTTTNGTIIHGEIQDWLYKNREKFFVTLSLDGTEEMHDINRSKSFSKIDLPFFKKTWTNTPVKMTISKDTLPYLSEGVIFLHTHGFSIQNNLAYGVDWSDSNNVVILKRELEKLVELYLSHPDIAPCSLMDMKIEYAGREAKKWCGVGTQMVIIDVDGEKYPCHAFLPMSLGREKAIDSQKIDFNATQIIIDPKCESCILHAICPTCYGANYAANDNTALRNEHLCRLTKIMALASSYLKVKRILANTEVEKLEGEKYFTIKSALEIQNQIKI
jgi:radical SAM protein with 4Fe4S-binding SPASM domain